MGSWLDRVQPTEDRLEGSPDGGWIGRSELIRFETSTGKVHEARRRRTHSRDEAATSVILTACHRDRALLRPAIHFLAHRGTSVFIDVREGGFPDQFSPECADWLRKCLERDRKLVLISTQEGLASPWTPWQLGLAEGVLGLENVALLPVEDYGFFRGSPLMRLYPAIRRREGEWSVLGPRGRIGPSLEEWLAD